MIFGGPPPSFAEADECSADLDVLGNAIAGLPASNDTRYVRGTGVLLVDHGSRVLFCSTFS